MGETQSSARESTFLSQPPPSAHFAEHPESATAESLAEAYGLGLFPRRGLSDSTDKINAGLSQRWIAGDYVGLDCEMAGVGPGGAESALVRASVVDLLGRQIYDSFVRPKAKVYDWRTRITGITAKDMRFARDFDEVQSDIAALLEGRTLVGHDVQHDLRALQLSHPPRDTIDTANFSVFRRYGHGRKPGLARLAAEILGVTIQDEAHSSIEDARATMLLYRRYKVQIDAEHGARYQNTTPRSRDTPNRSYRKQKRRR